MSDMDKLYILPAEQLTVIIKIQTQAFHEDPLWKYLFPKEQQRRTILPRFFRFLNVTIAKFTQILVAGDPPVGVILWEYPNRQGTPLNKNEPIGFRKLFFSSFLFASIKSLKIFLTFGKWRKKFAPKPHYYLSSVAVLPTAQGKGVASALIKPIIHQADTEGVPVYTETVTTRNVLIYEHLGFKIIAHKYLKNADLNLWGLLRYPRNPNYHE